MVWVDASTLGSGGSGSAKIQYSRQNVDIVTAWQCMPMVLVPTGQAKLASTSLLATYKYDGLVSDTSIDVASIGLIQTGGVLSATVTTWQTVTGEGIGLTEGADYYISNTAGRLTKDPTTITGVLQLVGVALSTTDFLLKDAIPITL